MIALYEALPAWAKAILAIGFPMFVALFYMAQEAGVIRSVQRETLTEIREVRNRQNQLIQDLLILCRNAATDAKGHPREPAYTTCENIK